MTLTTEQRDSVGTARGSEEAVSALVEPQRVAIQTWLVAKVSALIGVSVRSLDVDASFQAWGLDSIALVALTGELEEWLGIELSPVLLYEHPTIEKLAAHVARLSCQANSGKAGHVGSP